MTSLRADIDRESSGLHDLEENNKFALLIPRSSARVQRESIVSRLRSHTAALEDATEKHSKACPAVKSKDKLSWMAESGRYDLKALENEMGRLERLVEGNAVRTLVQPAIDVLPTALAALVLFFLAPIAIKLVAYFVVAPIASRCRPFTLLPSAHSELSALEGNEGRVGRDSIRSAVSQSIALAPGEELLVHGDDVQSMSVSTTKRTKWLLDWTMPFTSLACGLQGLMSIRASDRDVVVLSSSSDPLQELTVLKLPPGSAFVLQPRCLVGVVKVHESDLRITRHWRIAHLSSWLTLQLRYIVFHGPVTLVLRGCRGVRVEAVTRAERLINQAARWLQRERCIFDIPK